MRRSRPTTRRWKKLNVLAREPGVVAIGEIGLDYFYDNSPRDVQGRAFVQQMEIAAAQKLPILIHCRASADSTMRGMMFCRCWKIIGGRPAWAECCTVSPERRGTQDRRWT